VACPSGLLIELGAHRGDGLGIRRCGAIASNWQANAIVAGEAAVTL
jgi:hypothetical protein